MSTETANPIYEPNPPEHLTMRESFAIMRENYMNAWTADAYREPYVVNKVLGTQFIIVAKPEYIKHILLDNADNYVKSPMQQTTLIPFAGNGLLTSDGSFWRRQRRIMQPAFHHKSLMSFADTMVSATDKMLERWHNYAGTDEPLDVWEEMTHVTLDIISRTMFGTGMNEVDAAFVRHAFGVISKDLGTPPYQDLLGLPSWIPRFVSRRAKKVIRELRTFIENIIAERRASGSEGQGDLLDMLLNMRDEETGEGMTDGQLRDEVITVFLAGHETTANGLAWAWYILSERPDVERRLFEEVHGVLKVRAPTFEDLKAMPYNKMVFEETIRLFPPAPAFLRKAIGPDRIGDLDIPAGAEMTIAPWITHHHHDLWEKPNEFIPERFSPENSKKRHKYAYFPFGGGTRICIGNSFAMMEAQLIMATIVRKYRLKLVPGHPVEPLSKITLRPRYGVKVRIEHQEALAEAAD
ncbi:MAG TPA: cytochrome P450 [Sneathiellales bacterium]|nr:cytochrome P450 [Sneathiellales bacterium]